MTTTTDTKQKAEPLRGLALLRQDAHNKVLLLPCPNCKCRRYNPCTCMKKGK